MSTPKTAKMPIAITHYSDLDLSCQHLTTANFMEFNVAYQRELVPRQSIDIDMTTFVRMESLPVPTYGNCDIHNRAYFVPYRTVMRGWNEFIDDSTVVTYNGDVIYPSTPCLSSTELINLFINGYGYAEDLGPLFSVEDAYDFVYYNSSGESFAYKFTVLGKYTYKLLCSLGIKIHFDIRTETIYSALPLLSLMRVYSDWYFPSAYVDDEEMNALRKWFEKEPTDDVREFADEFDAGSMSIVFSRLFHVAYDSDYFVSSWDNPVAPSSSAFSFTRINDVTNDGLPSNRADVSTDFTNGTPLVNSGSSLSQFAVDALKAVTDYMRRNQISGARVLDRYLSRWGIQLPSAKLNRSEWIGESTSKFVFGDVFSTADTDGANLGSYAGRGAGRNSKAGIVSYTSSEFGMLIIISSIVPKTAYFQGCDRNVFHLNRLDFYTPEYDNLGVQALSTSELYVPTGELNPEDANESINYDNAVFGFVPRYSEYKRGYDNMTGDFVLGTQAASNRGWSLMRDVSDYYYSRDTTRYEDIVHSLSFVDAKDWQQYNRIFNVVSPIEDKFKIIHNFVVKSRFPGKPMYDSYEFREEDKAQKVTIDVNGVRAN